MEPGDAVFGYVWVTEDQRPASIRAIPETCGRAGWGLVDVLCDGVRQPAQHADVTAVLERIAAGEIGGLVTGHDGHGHDSATEGAGLDVGTLAGPDFALRGLGVDADGCDVALTTLSGRRSPGGRAMDLRGGPRRTCGDADEAKGVVRRSGTPKAVTGIQPRPDSSPPPRSSGDPVGEPVTFSGCAKPLVGAPRS